MKRLTIKNSDGTYSQAIDTTFEEIFNKCAGFEDFMEKYRFKNLHELEYIVNFSNILTSLLKENYDKLFNDDLKNRITNKKLEQENQSLKDRWQNLKDDLMLYYTVGETSGIYGYDVYKAIFDKMQELEKDD